MISMNRNFYNIGREGGGTQISYFAFRNRGYGGQKILVSDPPRFWSPLALLAYL